jgi:hypothetical protein
LWRRSVITTTVRTVGAGFFPLDEQLKVSDTSWSEALAKNALWLLGQVEDDMVERILWQIGGIAVSDTSIWRRMQVWGEKFRVLEEAEAAQAMVVPVRGGVVRGESQVARRMGVAMDGTMINVRDEGWKELKVGCVFEAETKGEAGTDEEQVHAVHNSYKALLGGPQRFGQALWAEASRRQLPRAQDSIVLGDGAPWIWNLASEHFSLSRQAVDWYHAKEHLYRVSHLALGEGTAEASRWAKGMETPLYQGQIHTVVAAIKRLAQKQRGAAQALYKEAEYFHRNRRRMQYMELREDGFPIGSGMVESAGKQFRARLAGPGMRWSRAGAERLISVRTAILSQRFEQLWPQAYSLPPN